jgi:energy-coupling factor transporter ATP-binding protein EcfA2
MSQSSSDYNQKIEVNESSINHANLGQVTTGDLTQIVGNVVTFNQTKIIQIAVEEIKTRQFIPTSPYRGLKKFQPEDKDLFFGRDQFLKELANELEQTNLILLLGASGSGKSSLVRAGLIPWLSQKYGSRLVNLTLNPDIDPFESLYGCLLSQYTQTQAQIAREAKTDILTQVVTSLKQPESYWFIFIDQFEELFTTSEAEKRDLFIKSLVQLTKGKAPRVKIIATMRADFLDKLSPYPAFVKVTDKHRPMIAEMQLDELRLAIEQPAAHHGVVFETGLVEEIIKDVQRQAGYLPLLQYTLNLLWETEVKTNSINDRTLNISTYRELGGVRGALQQRVDKIYEDLPAQEKIATQRIFLKLVDIGGDEDSGTEWKPVRRRALRSEFSLEEQDVLVKLINENLLVSDQKSTSQESTVEITHETLLTSWTSLNIWIRENRNSIALRNRLNDDVAHWQARKVEDELWAGSKLEQVLELQKDSTFNQVLGGFSSAANQFIDACAGLRDRRKKIERIRIGIAITGLISIILGSGYIYLKNQQQLYLYNSLSNVIEPKEAAILPDFFTQANHYKKNAYKYSKQDDIRKAFAYYRTIQSRACSLLLQKANLLQEVDCYQKINLDNEEKIYKLAKKSENFRVKMIHKYLIPELENQLEHKNFGEFQYGKAPRDGEQQYIGARRVVYGILTGRLNTGADLNGDGQVNTVEEVRLLPCKTIKEIEELWKKKDASKTSCNDNLDNLDSCTITGELLLETNNSPTIFAEARLKQCFSKNFLSQ